MDFAFSKRQQKISEDVLKICEKITDSDLQQHDRDGRYARDHFEILSASGVNAWLLSKKYGGQEFSASELVTALETMGEHCNDTGLVFSLAAHLCACVHPLLSFGSELQINNWMERISSGALLGAHAITEPSAGSDVYAMTTYAEQTADGFVVNGHKCYITNAPVADFIILHARTSHKGGLFDFSTFILDVNTPGVSVTKTPREKIGLRTTAMGDITFDQVQLDHSALLGHVGGGGPVFQISMEWERVCLFALYLGVMKRQLLLTMKQCENRIQFGSPIIENQFVSHSLVDMYSNYEASRLLLYKAAWQLDKGILTGLGSCIAKIKTSESIVNNSLSAINLHGAMGILSGEIERIHRDCIPSIIFSGSNSTLKNNAIKALQKQFVSEAKRRK